MNKGVMRRHHFIGQAILARPTWSKCFSTLAQTLKGEIGIGIHHLSPQPTVATKRWSKCFSTLARALGRQLNAATQYFKWQQENHGWKPSYDPMVRRSNSGRVLFFCATMVDSLKLGIF